MLKLFDKKHLQGGRESKKCGILKVYKKFFSKVKSFLLEVLIVALAIMVGLTFGTMILFLELIEKGCKVLRKAQ
ncbi:MAG: hypothetical protein PUH03_05995 [bacterium]|nr:hypothetical protein [bacterium]MDY2830397.1 hypothetical protein [Alphaproteobacteria bacterium]